MAEIESQCNERITRLNKKHRTEKFGAGLIMKFDCLTELNFFLFINLLDLCATICQLVLVNY